MTFPGRAAMAFLALALSAIGARAQVSISPQALEHYAYCIEQANQFNMVYPGDFVHIGERGITYRCRDEVAVAYFNDIGRRKRRSEDKFVTNETGAYVLRQISGVGFCWHKVEDQFRAPVSFWGCDVYVSH